jgi:hypothetical protein
VLAGLARCGPDDSTNTPHQTQAHPRTLTLTLTRTSYTRDARARVRTSKHNRNPCLPPIAEGQEAVGGRDRRSHPCLRQRRRPGPVGRTVPQQHRQPDGLLPALGAGPRHLLQAGAAGRFRVSEAREATVRAACACVRACVRACIWVACVYVCARACVHSCVCVARASGSWHTNL